MLGIERLLNLEVATIFHWWFLIFKNILTVKIDIKSLKFLHKQR